MSWGNEVESADDDEEESTDEETSPTVSQFPDVFEKTVRGSGSPKDIDELQYINNIDSIDDETLLREGWLQLDGEKASIVANRIEEIGGEVPNSGEEESDGDSSDDGWGDPDEEEDASEEDAAEPAIQSGEELDDVDDSEEEEASQSEPQSASEPPRPASAMTVDEAIEKDRRWKILVWGPPKLFKTHFCYTMPEPVAYLDLEGKADDIASKFRGKDIQIWQPKGMTANPDTKFRRAKKALGEAMEWLDWHYENEGKRGTIVVDSMSLMWEWAQMHHVLENYPLKDPEDVELSSHFNSSQESDWAVIKEYHNGEFRELITDSHYHFAWTAMERVDFERQLGDGDNNVQFMEPTGEPKNGYKADTIIRARKDPDRGKVGDMVGSNFTDNVFVGLKKPTFEKVQDAVEAIQQAESVEDPQPRSDLADQIDAETIIDYDPQTFVNEK